ncbi:N-acetylmuramoyl-L-alanine amidase [Paenibacillus tianmuensis]|uniref:N-acetylmuramoyl-L-alanine amidase n=1 Tax=Paenibacillus tianmuensis TaxID=624147 RepID=A0A1G4TPP8_9BACL|nr:N-acetylmuramoyl-L-alanine amidase [Paenibacillus tianmuensis]
MTGRPEKAWHVVYNTPIDNRMFGVDSNDYAGGVELCYGGKINLNEAYKRYVWVLAYACYRYGLNPATDITGHHILDPARKTDPVNALRLLGKTFEQLIADVVAEYQECTQEEDDDNMAIKAEDWFWKQAYNILGKAYNEKKIEWKWCQKVLDRTLTAGEYTHVLAVINARAQGVDVDAENPAAVAPDRRR